LGRLPIIFIGLEVVLLNLLYPYYQKNFKLFYGLVGIGQGPKKRSGKLFLKFKLPGEVLGTLGGGGKSMTYSWRIKG